MTSEPSGRDGNVGTGSGRIDVDVGSGVGSSLRTRSIVPPTTSGDPEGLGLGLAPGELLVLPGLEPPPPGRDDEVDPPPERKARAAGTVPT